MINAYFFVFPTVLEAADIEDRETVSVTPRPNKDAEDPIHEGTCGADDSKCPSQIEKNEELNRLKQENEIYRRALAWIDERQKLFTDKFINHSFASDKESIIKWLKDVRNAFYKKFNFGQEE